jgi:alpha-ribazole phosphatase
MDDRLVVALWRHGITDENECSAYMGWTDSPLNEKGRKMVQRLSKHVARPDLIFSSSSVRCLETARLLFPGQTIQRLAALREMHFGDWEGRTHEDLQHVASYQTWLDDPFSKAPAGGESFEQFAERVLAGWDFIKKQAMASRANHIAVITHGGVIRFLLSAFAPERKAFFEWQVPFAGGYELVWEQEGFRRDGPCISLREVPLTAKLNG